LVEPSGNLIESGPVMAAEGSAAPAFLRTG
jgi:hypothetical protein